MLTLANSGLEPTQRELADFLSLDPSQIVALMDELEKRGLVDPGARASRTGGPRSSPPPRRGPPCSGRREAAARAAEAAAAGRAQRHRGRGAEGTAPQGAVGTGSLIAARREEYPWGRRSHDRSERRHSAVPAGTCVPRPAARAQPGGAPQLEVWIAHMGGPFWARKEAQGWSIPKGEYPADEDPLAAAHRSSRRKSARRHLPPTTTGSATSASPPARSLRSSRPNRTFSPNES